MTAVKLRHPTLLRIEMTSYDNSGLVETNEKVNFT